MNIETKPNIIKEIVRLMAITFENNEFYADDDIENLKSKIEEDLNKRLGTELGSPINEKEKTLKPDKYSKLLEMENTLRGKKRAKIKNEKSEKVEEDKSKGIDD